MKRSPTAGDDSGGFFQGGRLGLFPVARGQFGHVLVGRAGQALQHILQIRRRLDVVEAAIFKECVDHRVACPGFFRSEKQPVVAVMESFA